MSATGSCSTTSRGWRTWCRWTRRGTTSATLRIPSPTTVRAATTPSSSTTPAATTSSAAAGTATAACASPSSRSASRLLPLPRPHTATPPLAAASRPPSSRSPSPSCPPPPSSSSTSTCEPWISRRLCCAKKLGSFSFLHLGWTKTIRVILCLFHVIRFETLQLIKLPVVFNASDNCMMPRSH